MDQEEKNKEGTAIKFDGGTLMRGGTAMQKEAQSEIQSAERYHAESITVGVMVSQSGKMAVLVAQYRDGAVIYSPLPPEAAEALAEDLMEAAKRVREGKVPNAQD